MKKKTRRGKKVARIKVAKRVSITDKMEEKAASREPVEVPIRCRTENTYWAAAAGSNIVEVLEEEDNSANYSVDVKHLYRLEDGRYAVVEECGCSCYSMADADVSTYDGLESAEVAYHNL